MTFLPLEGLRVLETGDLGELAGKLLADAGADVLKIEPLHGARSRYVGPFVDGQPGPDRSLKFAYLNTNKRSAALDIETEAGAAIWTRLLGTADVVIDSSGVRGLSRDNSREKPGQPERVIWCSITPFGLTGPRADWRANDLVSMAHGGIVMMCGYDDHTLPPVRPEGDHSLAIAGEYAVTGVLAALWQREFDGQGQHLDVSVHEAVAGTTEGAFMNWEYLGRNPSRVTGRHAGTAEEWQLLSSDGDYLVLFGAGVPRDRKSYDGLLAWMDEYGAAGDLRDPSYERLIYVPPNQGGELRQEFARKVAEFIATRPTEEVYRRGQSIGMPWAPVRRPEENLADAHWEDRGFWVDGTVNGTDKTVRYPRAAYNFLGTPVTFRRPAPRFGEHTREVLAGDLGIENTEIESLAQQGVVAQD